MRGRDPGQQVEEEEARPAQGVLDVVAEDPQEEHVAGDVEEPPCMNIDVKIVRIGAGTSEPTRQAPVSRHGTRPNSSTNACAARAPSAPPTSSEIW